VFLNRPHIIMLHHVSDRLEFKSLEPYSISNIKFAELLDYIQSHDLTTCTFYDYQNKNLTHKDVILTFDDCSKDLFDFAIPELLKRNMKAVFYIPTNHINGYNVWDVKEGKDKVGFFTEENLKELSIHSNFEIGSHSKTHRKLTQLNSKEVFQEFLGSKLLLEKITKKHVISFAHPFGEIPLRNKELLTKAGYRFACGIYVKKQNDLQLRRFIYHNGDNFQTLSKKMSLNYQLFRFLKDKF
jgi:peptidoglycan/xylan/chitin deacetylase (PgdA/CDA1 family)